jgi:hypothetical protein
MDVEVIAGIFSIGGEVEFSSAGFTSMEQLQTRRIKTR